MIQHTVAFRLRHETGSAGESEFMAAAMKLSSISHVLNFRALRQTSAKNEFTLGLIMDFETQEHYDAYGQHADHEDFIERYWKRDVEDFLEIDYVPYE